MQKGFGLISIILIVIVLFTLSVAAFEIYWKATCPNGINVNFHCEGLGLIPSIPDPKTGLKTYTDKIYNFSLSYPSNWRIIERSNDPNELSHLTLTGDPQLNTPNGGGPETGMHVTISNNSKNESLVDYVNKEVVAPDVSYMKGFDKTFTEKNLQVTNTTIDNIPAIKVTGLSGAGNPGSSVFIIKDKNIFDLSWEKTSQPNDDQLYNQILSTFKFTDQTSVVDTSSWKTYTNTEAKISFQYPSTWKVKVEQPTEDYKRISIDGKEGEIFLDYGSGFGGGCESSYEDFPIGNAQTQACHSLLDNGSEQWSLSAMQKNNVSFNNISYSGLVTVNSPYNDNRDLILKTLSTFKFTN